MEARLEHVNVTVGDADRAAALIQRLFGWRVRWAGAAASGGRTVHVGTDDQYLALYSSPGSDGRPLGWPKGEPLNHVAVVVDDLDAAEARVAEAGLTLSPMATTTPAVVSISSTRTGSSSKSSATADASRHPDERQVRAR